MDAGFKISRLYDGGLPRLVIRLAKNFTARHKDLPEDSHKGRPSEYGQRVGSLARPSRSK